MIASLLPPQAAAARENFNGESPARAGRNVPSHVVSWAAGRYKGFLGRGERFGWLICLDGWLVRRRVTSPFHGLFFLSQFVCARIIALAREAVDFWLSHTTRSIDHHPPLRHITPSNLLSMV